MSTSREPRHSKALRACITKRREWGKKGRLLEAIKLEELATGKPIPEDLTPQELLERLKPHFDCLGYRERERPKRRHVYYLRNGR